jgi:hypothetical protein
LKSGRRSLIKNYLIIATACIVLFLIPFKLTLAPERKIKVLTASEKPIRDATVRQIWCQYSLGVKGEEDFQTNSNGVVNLPKREVRTNIAKLCFGAINNFRKYFINAGYGSKESIGVFAKGYPDEWFHNSKNKPIDVIMLKK